MNASHVPRRFELKRHVRYRFDHVRNQHQLVIPEGLIVLNQTAAAIAQFCDGRTIEEIFVALDAQFDDYDRSDVQSFLDDLVQRGFMTGDHA